MSQELNNYYPFGLPEAGRSWSYEGRITNDINQPKYQDYTYGYNGMQRDNAKGVGSGYTTLFREYDPEIARWKSLDPKLKDFPSESPFSAMGNNPIMNTDVLGDEIKILWEGKEYTYRNGRIDGMRMIYNGDSFIMKVVYDLNQAQNASYELGRRMSILENSQQVHLIQESDNDNRNIAYRDDQRSGKSTGSTTEYNPYESRVLKGNQYRSPVVALTHELLSHGFDADQGTVDYSEVIVKIPFRAIPQYEINAVNIENLMRKANEEDPRTTIERLNLPKNEMKDPTVLYPLIPE